MKTATQVLLEILREITAFKDAPRELIAERIGPRLERELLDGDQWRTEYASLRPIDLARAQVSEELRYENQVKVLVAVPESELPYMAHLVLDNEGDWRLRSYYFQCPACFGTGIVVDLDLCGSCGAKGWGTVDF